MGWIIASSIVLFFALLLAGRVTVFFDYNGSMLLRIKYWGIRAIRIPRKKPKRPKKPKKKKVKAKKKGKNVPAEQNAEASEPVLAEKSGKPAKSKKKGGVMSLPFDDKLILLKIALSGFGKPLRKLLKNIKFSHMSINAVVGGDDAAKTAIKYGAVNIAVGNALGLIDSFFTLEELDDLNITVDFGSERSLYDCYFEVRLTLFAAVAAAFGFLGALLKLMKAYKSMQPPAKRTVKKSAKKK